ncbi:hypothetical protein A2483_03635, partial [Candidatus Peregrinibacteria bacterium RIFOXYC2_FULL_33_13]
RDESNYSRGGYAIIDITKPDKILEWSQKPTLEVGTLGCFDDCGAMPSCIVEHNGQKYMYYTGWTQQVKTPFSFFIGLAISKNNEKYKRYSLSPILGRNFYDPYLTASPYIIKENKLWRMWYVSSIGWEEKNPQNSVAPRHYYFIKHASSKDGINWETSKNICIDFIKKNDEYAIARPIVLKENNLYKMWYCYRGGSNTYRAGYAESKDGLKWTRKDNIVNLDVGKTGWDSEMICYPCVFKHKNNYYMLYNGNRYGQTGCGLAKLSNP